MREIIDAQITIKAIQPLTFCRDILIFGNNGKNIRKGDINIKKNEDERDIQKTEKMGLLVIVISVLVWLAFWSLVFDFSELLKKSKRNKSE